jgi:excinuclease UvrABC nuclease subunit
VSRTLVAYQKFRSLIKHKQDWVGANFAQDYFSQLNGDQQVLHSMIGSHSLSKAKYKDIDRFDAALDDLYLKVNACLLNGGKAVGSVSVTVHTKKSGVEVPNLRVLCMAKILQLYHNYSPTAFPQLSSPTKWELPPGNYIMWAENPETGQKSSTQEIPIDRNQECDLAVP